jgi:hypothetical protein
MFRDVILRWLLRHYEHFIPARLATVGLTVAHILKSLYHSDERRLQTRADECTATVARLELLIMKLERKEKHD